MKFDRRKQENKTSTFYAFTEYLCSTEARFALRCRTKKGAFRIRSPSTFSEDLWSAKNFIFSILEHPNLMFPEYLCRNKEREVMQIIKTHAISSKNHEISLKNHEKS